VGVFAGTVTSALAAFPRELVTGIAGLALIATTSTGLRTAFADDGEREAAFVTFAVTASGLTLLGIGSAFWGILAGAGFLALTAPRAK
jgi:benzoate membrane transport protein